MEAIHQATPAGAGRAEPELLREPIARPLSTPIQWYHCRWPSRLARAAARSGPAAQFALRTSTPDLNCGPRIGRHTSTGFGGPGSRRLIAHTGWRVPLLIREGRPDKRSVKPGGERDSHARGTGQSAEGFVTLRSEDRDSTCRLPTVWDALFGCVRAARVQVQAAHRRLVTRERMAVLCRGSND